jgi:hypothetical protein
MNANQIESKFAEMGARIKVREVPPEWAIADRSWRTNGDYAVDIQRDRKGEFFEVRIPERLREAVEISVMQSEPKKQHLLLAVRKTGEKPQLDRFLCGHDEREWFVAAVPGGASSVRQAMRALQPKIVRAAIESNRVPSRQRFDRKNRAFRRQGEWFFIPAPGFHAEKLRVLRNEPLRRGAGKPHIVEELCRTGGEWVYVASQRPSGLREAEYRKLLREDPDAAQWQWQTMRRTPIVHARGTVRHNDHATIELPFWHRVIMNTETETRTMANVAFLD